jgi:formate hydrogenlyase subunit 4
MTHAAPLAIAWALGVPCVLLAVAPLLDGVGRRVRARLESRAGPPLLQAYRDLAKLAGKHEVGSGANALASAMPYVALAAVVAAGVLLPLGAHASPVAGDAVVVLYLLGLSSVAIALAGSATGSPYAFLGAGRELLLVLFVEPVVGCALFVVALKCGSFRLEDMATWQLAHGPGVSGVLAGAAVLVALPAWSARLPFDLSEADQELMGGCTLEFGGRRLALLRWTLFVRWLVVTWLVVAVFAPLPASGALGPLVALAEGFALFVVVTAAGVLFARQRIDLARTVLVQSGLLAVFALLFAVIGV